MNETKERRERGDYPTPERFAILAHDHIRTYVSHPYDAVWWDPCAGSSGALIRDCPRETTVIATDLRIPPIGVGGRHVTLSSRMDFLNDEDLPFDVKKRLGDGSRWIFIFNPPFGSGVGGQLLPAGEEVRRGLSDTMVGRKMREAKMGLATRNMACQFIWRAETIIRENDLDAVVALFSPAAILNGPGYERFRRKFWFKEARCLGGFCFNSKYFDNITAEWPVVYSMWDRGEQKGDVEVDVVEDDSDDIPPKKIFLVPTLPLSALPRRPKATVVKPPMSGPLSVATGKIMVDRQSPDALATIYADGNDVQHSVSSCYIVTGSHPHTGSWSITPDNFHSSMLMFACRRLVSPNWLNWRDQFSQPNRDHPDFSQFKLDAITWALFDEKNLTSSVRLEYKGETYDLRNQFFWRTIVCGRQSSPFDFIMDDLEDDGGEKRFVATWIDEVGKRISQDVMDMVFCFTEFASDTMPYRHLCDPKFQLWRWDSGVYQVRRGMESISNLIPQDVMDRLDRFKRIHAEVEERLRPHLSTLGVL